MGETKVSRLAALARGERPDRVPISLSLANYAPRLMEIDARDFYLNPSIALSGVQYVKKKFPDDSGLGFGVPEGVCWDFGGEVFFPPGRCVWPKIVRFPANNAQELLALPVPDPKKAPAATLEFTFARLRQNAGYQGGVLTLTSPFRQTVQLAGVDQILKWMISRPELVRHACELTLAYSCRLMDMYKEEFGTEGWSIFVTYPVESHDLISPKMFREFSAPYAMRLHEEARKRGFCRFMEHPCGRHEHNLWFWRDALALPSHTTISIGSEMDIVKTGQALGPDLVIGGNVSSVTLLSQGPQEVYAETKEIIDKMKYRPGGFVLMASCVITTAVPPENITAMLDAVNDWGWYTDGLPEK